MTTVPISYSASVVVGLFVLCAVAVAALWLPKAVHHLSTGVAVLALSALVALIAPHIFNSWLEMALSLDLPPPFGSLFSNVHPIASANVLSPADVFSVGLVFYLMYGVNVVLKRLVDTVRILKVSRRRLVFYSGASGASDAKR